MIKKKPTVYHIIQYSMCLKKLCHYLDCMSIDRETKSVSVNFSNHAIDGIYSWSTQLHILSSTNFHVYK